MHTLQHTGVGKRRAWQDVIVKLPNSPLNTPLSRVTGSHHPAIDLVTFLSSHRQEQAELRELINLLRT